MSADGKWFVEVNQLTGSNGYQVEIDAPSFYLITHTTKLSTLADALELMTSSLENTPGKKTSLGLGTFGDSGVKLVRDNEESPRCFLVIGPKGANTLRITLAEPDLRAFCAALTPIVEQPNHDTDG